MKFAKRVFLIAGIYVREREPPLRFIQVRHMDCAQRIKTRSMWICSHSSKAKNQYRLNGIYDKIIS